LPSEKYFVINNMAEKDKSGIEILESAEALQKEFNKAESFFKTNGKVLGFILGFVTAVVGGYFGYTYWVDSQNEEAQAAMYPAVSYFESDSLTQALNGTAGNDGLLSIADQYSHTPAGKLANFYVGLIYLKQAKYDQAIEALSSFSSSDAILQGRAYALIGDAHVEKKAWDEAITAYQKAADFKPNKYFTPTYLMKLASVYVEKKQNTEAIAIYAKVAEQYATSMEALNAKKYKSKLEASVGE